MAVGEGRGGSPSGFLGGTTPNDIYKETAYETPSKNGGATQATASAIPADSSLIVIRDLRRSGLEASDIHARVLDAPERAVCRIPSRGEGYVIPYFDISGNQLPFYRVRILNADFATQGVKYKQPQKTQNHIYFPRKFKQTLSRYIQEHNHQRIIIITEGEKKASCADKLGFPSIALSGVDSWRSRTIILPADTEFYSTEKHAGADGRGRNKGSITARLPSTDTSVPELVTLAKGFGDLIDTITQYNLFPVVVFDSDNLGTIKAEVQRAATMLAYELVYLGIHANKIKQVVLPKMKSPQAPDVEDNIDSDSDNAKTGLDDFLMEYGPDEFQKLISRAITDPKAFPRHPNPKGFISTQLQNRMSRKSMQQVASMILTELDASGLRLRDKASGQPYYYDRDSAHLLPARMRDDKGAPFHEQMFGTLLYQRYGISANDAKVLVWLSSQFTGEEPIEDVTPRRVITLIGDREDALNPYGIAIQVSDSQFIAISPDPEHPIKVHTNGSMGILFEQDQVEPVDVDLLLEHFDHQLDEAIHSGGLLYSWWGDVLNQSSLGVRMSVNDQPDPQTGLIDPYIIYHLSETGMEMRAYATLLSYISPFLLRWRGLQLPIELTVGPPGSGKSSLYSLRLQILTGRPKLRNIPSDIKDFQASLAHSGGLHVTDNVNLLNKELKQRISDELCRITTEPNPHIEMRKYFTNTDVLRFPVNTVFAFTSIFPPFQNEDVIQRSVTFRTEYVAREPEGDWVTSRLEERGGREAWLAHHMVFLHLFLKYPWAEQFHTQHRLAHLEQALYTASQVLNLSQLGQDVQRTISMSHPDPIPASTSDPTPPPILSSEPIYQPPSGPSGPLEPKTDSDRDQTSTEGVPLIDLRPIPDPSTLSPQLQSPPPPPPVSLPNQFTFTPPIPLEYQGPRFSLGRALMRNQATEVTASDGMVRCIKDFIVYLTGNNPHKQSDPFFAAQISDWASGEEDYSDNEFMTNPRKMGRYMSERSSTLAQILHIYPITSYANRARYRYIPPSRHQLQPMPPNQNWDKD